MTNAEAIEILRKLGYLLRYYVHFYEHLYPGRISERWGDIAAIDAAISELEKNSANTPIGIRVEGKDPYTEVANIVEDWCRRNYYGSAFVTLSVGGCVTTEYLSFNGNTMEFEWDMDWWEGEKDVVLIGFRMRADVAFYGYPSGEGGVNDG